MKNINKNVNNNTHGITLIALVLTIIVLLILAAVSISTLVGENGILTKASEAAENTRIASLQEEVRLWNLENVMDSATGDSSTISETEFIEYLKDKGLLEDSEYVGGNIIIGDTTITLEGTVTTSWNSEEEVNNPSIETGMIPIKWNGTAWEICSLDDEEWFDYDNKEWANVMLSDGTYTEDTAVVGQTLETNELRKYVCMDT